MCGFDRSTRSDCCFKKKSDDSKHARQISLAWRLEHISNACLRSMSLDFHTGIYGNFKFSNVIVNDWKHLAVQILLE
jgi:hypothetical protein